MIAITSFTSCSFRSGPSKGRDYYDRARIKKGNVVSNYNYVRIWEIDKDHKWDVLLEVFSAVEQ